MYVTYEGLFAYSSILVAVFGLAIQIILAVIAIDQLKKK